jgi:N-acetylglucosaminyldiphosphoundecaprenol N-acetyl-beta-D-mannosaminyltransferase
VSEKAIKILGIRVDPLTTDELNFEIGKIIREGRKELVLNVNVNAINQALRHPWMAELLNSAAIVFCDGYGVILGAKVLGYHIPERITYADWLWDISSFCESEGFSFFFLGAEEGIAKTAADRLRKKFPRLKIVGTKNGYFDKTGAENDEVIKEINNVSPDILIVGFGMPTQELWLKENWHRINAHVALTGGACFDFISEIMRRAPRWMSDYGMEWLFRLLLEPRRMFTRYVIGNPLFLLRIIKERLSRDLLPSR